MLTIAEIAERYHMKQLHPNRHLWIDNDNVSLYVPDDKSLWAKDHVGIFTEKCG